ncbi:MAG: sigma-70 family RNA polymerase sigma factor [Christensenellaceae bacterium]|jgi:RNA polymerase sigma-70 factor (ECF subfamily)|nr:sigma-70 family RNA polymerase sigma factor [Christensenellaceae bacterium]
MLLGEFEALLRAHERVLFSFCRHLAQNRELAEELYQETALAAFETMKRIDPAQNPKAFLLQIAINKWKNLRRKAARRGRLAPGVPAEGRFEELPGGIEPEGAALERALQGRVGELLAAMKEGLRLPLILFYFGENDLGAIARALKIPKGTVKSRLHRGRELLREALTKEGWL